jgi:hypothetical protein
VISAVPSQTYKIKTEWLKDGCVCVNVSSEKNFEKDVREKVRISRIACSNTGYVLSNLALIIRRLFMFRRWGRLRF